MPPSAPPVPVWSPADLLVAALGGGFFLVLALGAWRLRRIRRLGLAGHAHRRLVLEGWELQWPEWWPPPRPDGAGGWSAGPLDHDGRLRIESLGGEGGPGDGTGPGAREAGGAAARGDAFLRRWCARRHVRFDDFQPESSPGAHGAVQSLEGRASLGGGKRAYLWLALAPGAAAGRALFFHYSASVLYGLADGVWLAAVASSARDTFPGHSAVRRTGPAGAVSPRQ